MPCILTRTVTMPLFALNEAVPTTFALPSPQASSS